MVVIAKPYCCVPAALEIALRYYGYDSWPQGRLAKELMTNLDPTALEENRGTDLRGNKLNIFFERNNINLRENYTHINLFLDEFDMLDYLVDTLDENVILCGYDYYSLFDTGEGCARHVSIIVNINVENRSIQLLDPGPKDYGQKWVDAAKLFDAIRKAKDGFSCIHARKVNCNG